MHDKTLNLLFDNPDLEAKALAVEVKSMLGNVIAGMAIMQESIAVTLFGYTMQALNKKNVTAKDIKEYIESIAKKPLKRLSDNEAKALIVLGVIKPKTRSKPLSLLANTVGRNDICPCGSGLKFKTCCMDLAKAHDREEYKKCLG